MGSSILETGFLLSLEPIIVQRLESSSFLRTNPSATKEKMINMPWYHALLYKALAIEILINASMRLETLCKKLIEDIEINQGINLV